MKKLFNPIPLFDPRQNWEREKTPGDNGELIEFQISSRWIFVSAQGLFSKHLSDHQNLPEIKGIVVCTGTILLVYVDCDCRPVFSPLIKLFNFSDWIWNWVSPQPSPLTGLSLLIANTVLLKKNHQNKYKIFVALWLLFEFKVGTFTEVLLSETVKIEHWVLRLDYCLSVFNSVIIEDCWDPLPPSSLHLLSVFIFAGVIIH